ncbi:hypothetical protein FBULB1_9858 [Fusarium bulbicola]|nr:hypothetical protein FBULB1_9858 [Fusarium bulbicola]
MLGAKYDRNHVALCSFPFWIPETDEAFAYILEYIHIRKTLITPEEFGILLRTYKARRIAACVEACRQYFPHDSYRFDGVILGELSHGFSKLSADQMSNAQLEEWAPLFTDIVTRSRGLLTGFKYRKFTRTVWFILWHSSDPDDAWYRVCRWVDMLELAQVDVANYLKATIEYCSDNWANNKAWGFYGLQDSAVHRPLRLGYLLDRIR